VTDSMGRVQAEDGETHVDECVCDAVGWGTGRAGRSTGTRIGSWHCARSQYSQFSRSPLQTKHHGRVSLSGFLKPQKVSCQSVGIP
jgi:hypothetical protein